MVASGLLAGSTIVLYNGSPAYPDMNVLWQLAQDTEMTYFGTSAAYISACMKAGLEPGRQYDLDPLRAIGSTGSPLSVDGFKYRILITITVKMMQMVTTYILLSL